VLLVEEDQVIIRLLRALGRVGQRHAQRMIAPALPVGSDISPNGLIDHSGRKATARDFLERAVRREAVQVETLFPDENFMRRCEALGFNRNNSIVNLMPLLTYISERSI